MMDPITLALAGLLAYRTYQGKGKVAEWIGHQGPNAAPGASPGLNLPPLLEKIGAAPIAQGLADLLKDFQTKGFGETAKSWVEKGPNQSITAPDLERALGEQKIEWLMRQTGMSRDALLEGLSRDLPTAVDQLTPDGRLPTEGEAAARIQTMSPASAIGRGH